MILVAKLVAPVEGELWRLSQIHGTEPRLALRLGELLLVPLGSLVVVTIRLTLGLRMLGPFRPILIAIGLRGAGLVPGLVVFASISAGVVLVRPWLHGGWLPYFGRLTALLAVVVLAEVVLILAGQAFEVTLLERAATFPIVVLCLASDGFARALDREGVASALWRAGVTLATAMVIYSLIVTPGLGSTHMRHPELLLIELAAILGVAQFGRWELLGHLNPRGVDTAPEAEEVHGP